MDGESVSGRASRPPGLHQGRGRLQKDAGSDPRRIGTIGRPLLHLEDHTATEDGRITDRFSKAVEQLGARNSDGSKQIEPRLGGIYALERIARDSARDAWPIMEILSAYVRENAPRKFPSVTLKRAFQSDQIPKGASPTPTFRRS